ncbi:hypothetical protein BDA99DRAFT_565769 [Phascolomyces articulosus]|uniref:DMAP1-binding domain-containing protein n=1 Tax=Phascolomyces articulosus TaxID=60185 RepID=A0AAD5P868_9FUNG|nr:hypothetical protein BDA99DRAFT_565769 [Phascolomyces articulosus]
MTVESDQDLPHELLEKLKNLELELEDGDITQKGFEKKKATLMEQFSQNEEQRQQQASASSHNDNTELADLGPEPSAADVVDFLDYLPSPTHSPPKPASGAALMEQNHRQLQDQPQQVQPQQVQVQQHPVQQQPQYPSVSQQSSYRPYPQQQPQQQQQWQQPPISYGYNGTMQAPDRTHSQSGAGQYYHTGVTSSPRPSRPYDPRMAPPRPQYPGNGPTQSSPSMRHQPPYGYSSQRPGPPPQGAYRTGPPPPSNPQYRPVYNTAPPPQQQRPVQQQMAGSPRPVYRTGTVTQQPIRPNNYRPVMPPQGNPAHMRTSSLDARSDMIQQQQHPRPGYNYGAPPPRSHQMPPPPPRNIPPEAWRGQ